MKKCRWYLVLLCVFYWLIIYSPALAKVSWGEAYRLGKELTPTGAIKAGNAEGTIPAWEPMKRAPNGIKQPDNKKGERYPDPWQDERPLYSITAQNYRDYADKLSDGQKMMFERYSDYRMLVYPTHRPYSVPRRIYKATEQNALHCTITEDEMGFKNAQGGIPFPIPKSGAEVIHNHLNHYKCDTYSVSGRSMVVFPDGDHSIMARNTIWMKFPFHNENSMGKNISVQMFATYDEPPRRKGELAMFYDPVDWTSGDRKVWQYLTGQRRVRRAPNLAYDTPNRSTCNMSTYDDIFMFLGKMDRYNWKLLGKKEMYVRYNNYKPDNIPFTEYLKGRFWDPDYDRWELHRVWVVEADLKEGKRHIYGRRVFYVDEDSWMVLLVDKYDNRGKLWRSQNSNVMQFYGQDCILARQWQYYDITTETYAVENVIQNDNLKGYRLNIRVPDKYFTVEYMRRIGRR